MAISDATYNYCSDSESHTLGTNMKNKSIFKTPLLFVGLGPQGLLDSDSIRSPTSPLDVTLLSKLGHQRKWDSTKVGLSIIDSLEDCSKISDNILLSSECKKSSPKMITKAPNFKSCIDSVHASKSLPKDFFKLPYTQSGSISYKGESSSSSVVFEIGEPFDSNNFDSSFPPHFIRGSLNEKALQSSNELIKCLSASEIEDSEDYTCVISHGPNPKTTHIFCDCVLDIYADDLNKHHVNEEKEGLSSPAIDRLETPNRYEYPSGGFLCFCYHCNKKLEEGKDIYIYRGEKAFCSLTCRAMEIMIDEELEETNKPCENSLEWECGGENFETEISTST